MQSEKDGKGMNGKGIYVVGAAAAENSFQTKRKKIISKCHKIVNVKLFDFSMSPEA